MSVSPAVVNSETDVADSDTTSDARNGDTDTETDWDSDTVSNTDAVSNPRHGCGHWNRNLGRRYWYCMGHRLR